MLDSKAELHNWYKNLNEFQKIILWQRFSSFLNNSELKICMSEVKKGKHDLFEIHYKHGFINKYQIYFYQVMRNIHEMEDEYGRES